VFANVESHFILIFVLGICATIILRATSFGPASELAAAIPLDRPDLGSTSEANDVVVVNSGAKADKLMIATSASTTKAVAVEPLVKASAEKKGLAPVFLETKSWHWSARSNKITRK
jgi:hypothetical protein